MTTTSSTSSSTSSTTAATAASTSSSSTASSSTASIGASILSSLNANGASIDSGALVTSLTAAQKSALEDPITTKQTAVAAQISSAASIASDLSTFSTALNSLVSGGTLQTQPVSSDTSVLGVAAITGTLIGALSGTVSVTQLAQSQTLESQPISSTTSYASGTFGITTTGGKTLSLTAGTDFTDLASLVTAINAKTSTTGVTASTVTDSSGSHLVMKSTTGSAAGFSVAATGDVSGFAYTPTDGDTTGTNVATGTGMQRLQVAQDANFTVDGVAYTRASNSVSDAINGVQMTLTKVGTSTLSSTRPTSAIASAVSDFVSAYNTVKADLATATAAATSTASAGPLRGNSAMRDIQSQLAKLTTTPLNASGTVRTLAELGVKTAQDGTLSVDTTVLSNMLTNYPDDVEAMFTTSQSSGSSKVLITSAAGTAASGTYTLTNITSATGGGSANGGTDATGTLDGVAMTGASWALTPGAGSAASGLTLQVLSGAPTTTTITINQGLGGALQALVDSLNKTDTSGNGIGSLATLTKSLNTQSTSLADQLTKADAQLTVYHDRLVTQFTEMNTLVSGYKATASYLTQQVALWTNPDAT